MVREEGIELNRAVAHLEPVDDPTHRPDHEKEWYSLHGFGGRVQNDEIKYIMHWNRDCFCTCDILRQNVEEHFRWRQQLHQRYIQPIAKSWFQIESTHPHLHASVVGGMNVLLETIPSKRRIYSMEIYYTINHLGICCKCCWDIAIYPEQEALDILRLALLSLSAFWIPRCFGAKVAKSPFREHELRHLPSNYTKPTRII